jgi:hypothetical protein
MHKIRLRKIFLGSSSKECTRVSARILLVPISIGQPNTQDLELKNRRRKRK